MRRRTVLTDTPTRLLILGTEKPTCSAGFEECQIWVFQLRHYIKQSALRHLGGNVPRRNAAIHRRQLPCACVLQICTSTHRILDRTVAPVPQLIPSPKAPGDKPPACIRNLLHTQGLFLCHLASICRSQEPEYFDRIGKTPSSAREQREREIETERRELE